MLGPAVVGHELLIVLRHYVDTNVFKKSFNGRVEKCHGAVVVGVKMSFLLLRSSVWNVKFFT